jgi:hypothetical protein
VRGGWVEVIAAQNFTFSFHHECQTIRGTGRASPLARLSQRLCRSTERGGTKDYYDLTIMRTRDRRGESQTTAQQGLTQTARLLHSIVMERDSSEGAGPPTPVDISRTNSPTRPPPTREGKRSGSIWLKSELFAETRGSRLRSGLERRRQGRRKGQGMIQ